MKKLPNWLKVGIYISLIYFVIGFPLQLFYFYENSHAVQNNDLGAGLLSLAVNFPVYFTWGLIIPKDLGILSVLLIIPGYFVIGIILGWIYGKIKNRKMAGQDDGVSHR